MVPVYAILDIDVVVARRLRPLDVVDTWLNAGIRLVQLRAKSLTTGPMLEIADQVGERCRAAGATFIVNDRADVARMAAATGVHVGQEDLQPVDVRAIVGTNSIVGYSTHTADQVDRAIDAPIDYLAIGPVFQTTTKEPAWPTVGLLGVQSAVEQTRGRLPVVAIGGITLDHARRLIDAGAASVAVISDLLVEPIDARAKEYLRALQ